MDSIEARNQGTLRVGRVVAVSASQVMVLLERAYLAAQLQEGAPLEMGSLVKIKTRVSTVYAMVSSMRLPLPTQTPSADDLKIVELELLGETIRETEEDSDIFRRGVSVFPALDDPVYIASADDLRNVYAPPKVATVPIGSIHQDSGVPAYLLTDDLLGKHFSIVGTTGSGKSCAVATILRGVIEHNPDAHVILIDPHDEYRSAFGDESVSLSPGRGLHLPYWLFNFEEISEMVLGKVDHRAEQMKIFGDAIIASKQAFLSKVGLDKHGTVDTPAPYRMSDLLRYLDNAMGSLNRPEAVGDYLAVKSRILALQNDIRYEFVFGASLSMRDEMTDILSQMFRIPVEDKPITILDISGIPSDVLNVVVSVLCRLAFDFSMWSEDPVPVTIVCEEAHRYAPRDQELGFEPAKRALSRIAKEGRKYGVSMCVVSQRPSDLAPGLLSECNTMFALRMTNHDDQDIVRSAIPEASHGLMSFLPALRNGEAIAVGEGVSMPMRICFAPLPIERRPTSASASFSKAWAKGKDTGGRSKIEQTVERWRRGIRYAA
jgi:DNA helicase HerA-like ATPase